MAFHDTSLGRFNYRNTKISTTEMGVDNVFREYVIQGILPADQVSKLFGIAVGHKKCILPRQLGLTDEPYRWESIEDIIPTDDSATVLLDSRGLTILIGAVDCDMWNFSEAGLEDIDVLMDLDDSRDDEEYRPGF